MIKFIIVTAVLCLISFCLWIYTEVAEFRRIGICPYCKKRIKMTEMMDAHEVLHCEECNNYASVHAWRKTAWREI